MCITIHYNYDYQCVYIVYALYFKYEYVYKRVHRKDVSCASIYVQNQTQKCTKKTTP